MDAEILKQIELIVGSIGVILALFFSIFLLTNREKQAKANIFLAIYLVAFALRIGKSLFHNFLVIDATLRTYFLSTLLCVGPSIWLYTNSLTQEHKVRNVSDFLHYTPFICFLGICWFIPNDGSPIFGVFYNFLTLHMFCYTVFAIFWFLKKRKTTVRLQNTPINTWLIYFLLINLAFIALYFLISALIIPFYIGLSFLFSLVILLFSFWALKNPSLFRVTPEKYKDSQMDLDEANKLISNLKKLMNEQKPYLDPALSLAELSSKMGVTSKVLSQAVNQIEKLNYSQFISKYRIEEVQRLMQLAANEKKTISTLAYESGFNSISTFNAAFKKHTQTTAKAYRNSLAK